ncbi:ectonucleotide pyrophosphatase/phosphodiesterase [Pseudoxanthomonas indica]|uniref:Predicted pyrophosphatase or phosphodiesterase, AlkP superfamily n=1 Tax=Pseudoxanthomonas indica TaxID=428993 RepID=A0A1T5LPP4_9GAMM|nr:ectonucleotide pyrophosphatase/phosphodiesterase [Pseudoxanthomonas indica]GGD37400.1 alkaline phosphatase family protein [Pseudoxanthomonas indica]SKC77529.1 Predicted pyrophosphatase or phosphodiesterase, AlkP superfamily [Pseudoxanthomonas indica]
MPLPLVRAAQLACLVLVLTACASRPPSASRPASDIPATLLLVSVDGLRADYLGRGLTPHLDALAREGVQAEWMKPSYPSLTFPNHYTLVTGLRPDHHGIVGNTIGDETLGRFVPSDSQAVGDGRWWGGEPIWVGAENAGLRTATLFWPGSEAAVQGVRPSQWRRYDKAYPLEQRVSQVRQWLDLPAAQRPRLITLYFDQVDAAGHDHGPDSPEVAQRLREVDAAIGELRSYFEARGAALPVNLIVVSDHGMTATSPDRMVAIESLAPAEVADTINSGQVVGFVPKPGRVQQAEQRLLGRHGAVECWRKQDMPARWHYGSHPRIAPIVCQADEGWLIERQSKIDSRRAEDWRGGGAHGYDPALPSMRAIFMASGPAFRTRVRVPAFDNVDVYPLLARLLGIPAAANDGKPETLGGIIATPEPIPHR